jgi:hypothetical protein
MQKPSFFGGWATSLGDTERELFAAGDFLRGVFGLPRLPIDL